MSGIVPRFLDPLQLEERTGTADPLWRLIHELRYDSAVFGGRIVVDAGFLTDLSSIPRVPYVYWRLGGRGRRAGVIHDKLYRTHGLGRFPGQPARARQLADAVYLEALSVSEDLPADLRWAAWAGLRVGGWVAWRRQP